jgi:subtilase family serine protease
VKNEGDADAGAFSVRFTSAQTGTANVGGLAAGATTTVAVPPGVCAQAGDPLSATADSGGTVSESNEGNNSANGTC